MQLQCILVLLIQTLLTVSSQRIQGRYSTSNNQRCTSPAGCHPTGDSSYESDDKYESVDGYRSVRRTDDDKNNPQAEDSASKHGRVRFVHELKEKDISDNPGYVAEPAYGPNPTQTSKSYGHNPSISEDAYNKPARGSDRERHVATTNNAKPAFDAPRSIDDHRPISEDAYNKPPRGSDRPRHVATVNNAKPTFDTSRSIENPKPARYIPRDPNEKTHLPPEHYIPRPKNDDYRLKPDRYNPTSIDRTPDVDHIPNHGIARPDVKYDYHKPRPEPNYHNKDLGAYYVPKDEGYPMKGSGDDILKPNPPPGIGGSNCICVPYYQCQDGHIVTDGAGIIDARKKPGPDEEMPLEAKFKPPSCGPFQVCCNTPEASTVKPYEHKCGVRNPSGINSRLLSPSNKGEADFGEWPWQAAVLKSEGKVNIFMCGGVLIDKLHVITVAHCVIHLHKYDDYPLKVRLGEWDTQITSEFLAHEDYRVSKIFIHPDFNNTNLRNDIAILRLENDVLFAPHIDTICLPRYDEIFVQQNCVVTGWGMDAYKGGTFSNVMKEVALQVIDNYQCEEMLRKTRLGRFFHLHEGFLCAGGEYGLDSCKGDGGGPLVCYRKDKSYALAGIVSWGIDCGQPGVPGVYVKIQKYLDWISKTTGTELQDYWPRH